MTAYAIIVEPLDEEDGGGYLAAFPDLPGCMSDGETEVEAITNALDAFRAWMEVQTERGAQIPVPGEAYSEAVRAEKFADDEVERLRSELAAARAEIARLKAGPSRWVRGNSHEKDEKREDHFS